MQIEYKNISNKRKIIDIRNSISFSEKNIKGSVNIPKYILMSSPDKYLNKKDIYYLLCDMGKVSLFCSKILNSMGYKCYSIKGGIEEIKGS